MSAVVGVVTASAFVAQIDAHTTNDVHWGAIFAGVGGIATAGALLVSLVLLQQQMRDQRRARVDRRREHASHVAFWVELAEVEDTVGDVVIRAHYGNTSLQAVMSLLMLIGIRGDIWASAGAKERVAEWAAVAIGPGVEDATHTFRLERLPSKVVQGVERFGDLAVIGELHFTDSPGVDWVRTSRGQLIARNSALWVSLVPLSLAGRCFRLEVSSFRHGIRRRLLYWAIARLS